MRVKKLLKIAGVTLASLVILLLLLVAAFVYNPFEASLPAMKDVVPRNVDFCVRKAKLLQDFEGREDGFPVIPALQELLNREAWQQVLSGPAAQGLGLRGLEQGLADARRTFQELRDNHIHLVRDVLGEEVLVAGRFVSRDQTRWCAYLSVSWRIRFAYGLLRYGFVQERLRQNGISVQEVGVEPPFYKIRLRASPQDLFVIRVRNCLIVANDQKLAQDSYECAVGGPDAPEPLALSQHYLDGVDSALNVWKKRTEVAQPNTLEVFLQPGQLLPLIPQLRHWPNPKKEDNREERVAASFVNFNSWRFLSGSLVFEPNSLSVLLNLEVDNTQHTRFLRDFFKTEPDDRSKWMDEFVGMVPADAVAAAALRVPAEGFLHEMYEQALESAEKEVLNDALRQTSVYKSVTDLIDKVKHSFLHRVGIVFSKNVRTEQLRKIFPVHEETAKPQFVWVFWVAPGREQPVQEFVKTLTKHMGAFGFTVPYKLTLLRGSSADVAYEFAHPMIAGTGMLAVCTYGFGAGRGQTQYFFVGNSSELIKGMLNARFDKVPSLRNEPDYQNNFEPELPSAVNGLVWISGRHTREVLQALLEERQHGGDRPPPEWDLANRPAAEQTVLYQKYRQYHSRSGIPPEYRQRFHDEVTRELDKMWEKKKADYSAEGRAELEQWIHLTEALRSLYLQVILDPHSLQLTGRVLATEYR